MFEVDDDPKKKKELVEFFRLVDVATIVYKVTNPPCLFSLKK